MVVDSTLDAYAISLGFYIYNIMWDVFVETGIVLLPIIALIVNATKRVLESGMEDKNTRSAIRTVWVGSLLIICAFELALFPMVKLNVDGVKYFKRQCTDDSNVGGTVSSSIQGESNEYVVSNMKVQINDRDVMIPVLFYVAIRVVSGLKNEIVTQLPCTTDIRLVSDSMLTQSIEDEALRNEVSDFVKTCYDPARSKYLKSWNRGIIEADNWPGSRTLLTNSGYYNNSDGDGFYSKKALPGFGGTTNVVEESANLPADYGFPTCKEWWLGVGQVNTPYVSSEALSTRLYDSLSEWLKNNDNGIYEVITSKLNTVKRTNYVYIAKKDAVVREALFSPIKLQQLQSLTTTDYGLQGKTSVTDWIFRALGTAGVASKSIEQFSGASMLQIGMPMVKSFLILGIIVSFLPAMIMAGYKWKYIGVFIGVVSSILFWPFFWELARLIDDTIITAMGIGISEVNTLMLSQWISSAFYLYGPILFSTCLGWVGMVSADGAFQKMAGAAGSAGQSGPGAAKSGLNKTKNIAKKVATKGAK
ncbi:TPA: conjugal transfer protein TraG N-terminal domain-containing protein [Shewanella algae]|uniref:conjugal transfer protein TraG N-terminal domain-containing protein n=1 Tax=Shewanella algae TaxID=38313 RepID=UPI001C5763E1|nr:conjugal transfer protein TraG N-terminal domain-containing protein [Shewanella algae]HDS1208435.1 conjugal transfer protein TraG N-terminal domain-containing protein [Shewanella algae]